MLVFLCGYDFDVGCVVLVLDYWQWINLGLCSGPSLGVDGEHFLIFVLN